LDGQADAAIMASAEMVTAEENPFLARGDVHCFGHELAAGRGRALENNELISGGRGAANFEFPPHGESAVARVAAPFGIVPVFRRCVGGCRVRAGSFRAARPGEGRRENLEQPLQDVWFVRT
jgi:hypothetical protein